MKAFLAWHDVPFRKTHNLEELGHQCLAVDATLRAVAECAAPLTEYAWNSAILANRTNPVPRRPSGRWHRPDKCTKPS